MKESKEESALATIAALIVLFSAMIKPITSAMLAFVFLLLWAVYKFFKK